MMLYYATNNGPEIVYDCNLLDMKMNTWLMVATLRWIWEEMKKVSETVIEELHIECLGGDCDLDEVLYFLLGQRWLY